MTREELFAIWAPDTSRWSNWVKPVLFAQMEPPATELESPANYRFNLNWVPPIIRNVAIVADLPGPSGVYLGLELAREGFRPVPLYNSVLGPAGEMIYNGPWSSVSQFAISLVDMQPIAEALLRAAPELKALHLPPDAPPVFLLDSHRFQYTGPLVPGRFDNRSISFPTDFPSAEKLAQHSIQSVILLQTVNGQPRDDLSRTLTAWQKAGIAIFCKNLNQPGLPQLTRIQPSRLRWLVCWLTSVFSLRYQSSGGYGGVIPASSG